MSVTRTSSAGKSSRQVEADEAKRILARQHRRHEIIAYAVLILLAAFFLFPIVFMFVGSFKPDTSVIADSGSLKAFIPEPFVGLENYQQAAERGNFWTSFLNSVIISGAIVGVGLVVNSLLGYALARLRFRGRSVLLAFVVALIIVPFETLAVPLLLIMSELRWPNTLPRPVPALPRATAFSIFLFYSFFMGLPVELEEAARIDGAGAATVFFRIQRHGQAG